MSVFLYRHVSILLDVCYDIYHSGGLLTHWNRKTVATTWQTILQNRSILTYNSDTCNILRRISFTPVVHRDVFLSNALLLELCLLPGYSWYEPVWCHLTRYFIPAGHQAFTSMPPYHHTYVSMEGRTVGHQTPAKHSHIYSTLHYNINLNVQPQPSYTHSHTCRKYSKSSSKPCRVAGWIIEHR